MSDRIPTLKAVTRRPNFHVVTEAPEAVAESPATRAKRLRSEAAQAIDEHLAGLLGAVNEAERFMAETAGLDGAPVGVRDLCRRETPKLEALVKTLAALKGRT